MSRMDNAMPLTPSRTQITGLKRDAYTSPEIFQRELTEFFFSTWQYAGHESEFDAPGTFRRFTLGTADVIVIRGKDGALRALHNTCRHRGAQLLSDDSGVRRRSIICSYHAWTYDTAGALVGAPMMNEIDKEGLGLREAKIEVWNGIIFVNVDGNTPRSVGEVLAGVEWPANDVAQSKVAKVMSFDLRTNWKASWENALECYHCSINHPELIGILDRVGGGRVTEGGTEYSYGGNPLKTGNVSVTMSGQVESKVLYDLRVPVEDARGFLQWHRAAFEMIFSPDHIALMTYQPLTPETTRVVQTFLVPAAAEPKVDFDPDTMFGMHILTREQDNSLCELIQAGLRNPAYTPGPFNEVYECSNMDFVGMYRQVMGKVAD
jgi:Rieske 2Fe-2S family protein